MAKNESYEDYRDEEIYQPWRRVEQDLRNTERRLHAANNRVAILQMTLETIREDIEGLCRLELDPKATGTLLGMMLLIDTAISKD